MWLTHPDWCDASALGRVKRLFYQTGIRRALAYSDRIAVVSEATRDAIIDLDPDLADRVEVTSSGVSLRFRPVERNAQLLGQLGLPEGARFVLVVGQFAPYKNHERALDAFARALGEDREAYLVMVQRQGQGSSHLAPLARRLGIADRVKFLESVGERELLQLYSSAEMLLHPSLCEGFGNPIAEAMACGCPVITSDCSAMPEVAGGAAVLVDPQDVASIEKALARLWNDDAEREAVRKAGLKRARNLDWAEFARANLAIYRSLLA